MLEAASDLVKYLVILILSLSVHEYAHAWVAFRLGDDTASRIGRMTLNPLAHIDPIGTLVIPAFAALTGVPVFGWAKPVPVNPLRFRRDVSMRMGMALTAAAGPLSNFVLAAIAAVGFRVVVAFWGLPGGMETSLRSAAVEFCLAMVAINVLLGLFNLIPIPPLDGSRLLPQSMDRFRQVASRYSFLLIILVIATPIGTPIFIVWRLLTRLLTGGLM